jgi:hypothetical protein
MQLQFRGKKARFDLYTMEWARHCKCACRHSLAAVLCLGAFDSNTERSMPVTKFPEMVACAGAVLASSESHVPALTVTLKTEEGDRYMLPLSERAITQLSEVIKKWRRTRDFLDHQEVPEKPFAWA